MKDFYFRHDFHAGSDQKIIKLLQKEGWQGYGIYWGLIERLYSEGGFIQMDYESIAYDMRTQSDCIKSVIENYDLFEIDGQTFTSPRVIDELEYMRDRSQKARDSANKRWFKAPNGKDNDANALQPDCDSNAKENKREKNRIKKNRKENHNPKFQIPTFDQIKEYCFERKNNINPDSFINFYESKGWLIGKTPMKNWQAAIRTWEKNQNGGTNANTKHNTTNDNLKIIGEYYETATKTKSANICKDDDDIELALS